MRFNSFPVLLSFFAMALLPACNDDQLYNQAVVETTFNASDAEGNPNIVLDGVFLNFHELYLSARKDDNATASATVARGESSIELITDPQAIYRFSLGRGSYDSLTLVTKLTTNHHKLVLRDSVAYIPPPGMPEGDNDDNDSSEDGDSSEDDQDENGSTPDEEPESPEQQDDSDAPDDDTPDQPADPPPSGGSDNGGQPDSDNGGEAGGDNDQDGNGQGGKDEGDKGKDGKDKGDKGKDGKEKGDKGKDGKGKGKDKSKGNKGGRQNVAANQIVDLAEYFSTAQPAILFSFRYSTGNNGIRVYVVIDDYSSLTFSNREEQFVVNAQYGNSIVATINGTRLLASITATDIQQSSLIQFKNERVLFLHKDYNTPIFRKIESQLNSVLSLEVNKR